ncbi:MAG: ABC transporter permease [Nitrososphaeraceae archaeon]
MLEFWGKYKKNRLGIVALGFIVVFSLLSVLASHFSPDGPFGIGSEPVLAPNILAGHPMGTDNLGRDIFSGFLNGGQVSITIGVLAALGSTVIGIMVGAIAGFYGGIVDSTLMRITEFFQILPSFLLALVLIAILEPSFFNVVLVMVVASWPYTARIIRAEFLSLREREFVLSAIAEGRSNRAIIFYEILPNAIAPAIVIASFIVADAILIETGLSFIGLGDQNLISWGYMIRNSVEYMREAWWMTLFPGMAVVLTALAFNLMAFALNDVLNPRQREWSKKEIDSSRL